jgi:hypothetical protein
VYVQKLFRGGNVCRLAGLGTIILGGCGVAVGPDGNDERRPTLNLSTVGLDSESTYFETDTNDLFDAAEFVEATEEPRVIRGEISGADDVDVYDLGPVVPGDRIIVEMTPADSLDAAIALFDEQGTALLVNDHRNAYLGRVEPFVDVVIMHESSACYVAVSATPGYASSGDYALIASKEYPTDLPDPRPDTVLLVFDGGEGVRIGSRPAVDVPVFDAANIDPVYAGDTELMAAEIVKHVRRDYAGMDLTILSTAEGDVFEPGMTRIFFGTFDPALLGVAENVDEFNAEKGQNAIVFTDTFAAFIRLEPSVQEMAQAIANVSSHEIGHLFGLVHTDDPAALMDVTASLSELTLDQEFSRSPLYAAVFPLGYQDDVQYLFDVLGGDPAARPAKRRDAALHAVGPSPDAGPPARTGLCLSSCCLLDH